MTIRSLLRSAFATWRSRPGRVPAVLGVLALTWSAPYLIAERLLPVGGPSIGRMLLALFNWIWWAPLMGGHILSTLQMCREGDAPARRVLDGLASTGPLVVLMLLMSAVTLPVELLSTSPDAEPGALDVLVFVWIEQPGAALREPPAGTERLMLAGGHLYVALRAPGGLA